MNPRYERLVSDVLCEGFDTEVRGHSTRELLGTRVTFEPGELVTRKGVNRALGYMELLQLLAGVFDLDALKRVAPKAQHDLFTPQMAYGPRIKDQLLPVVEALYGDPTTRQAVLYVGSAANGPTSSLPCTETIQFLRRGGFLHTYVAMRSWDLVKGLTYDVVMFGGLAMAIAMILGDTAGPVTVTAGSAHIYAEDFAKARDIPAQHDRFNFAEGATYGICRRVADYHCFEVADQVRILQSLACLDVGLPEWTKGAPPIIQESI